MKKFVGGMVILIVLGIVGTDSVICVEENKNGEVAAEKVIKKTKKKPKRITSFDTTAGFEEKIIEVNSVNFIKLKDKAGQVFVPNPKVADVDVIDETSLYLTALKPGITSVVVQDKNGNVMANYKVRVTYPLDEIKSTVKSLYPDCVFELSSLDESVIMKGKATSPEEAAEIQNIVEKYVEASKVINKLDIVTATQVMLKVKVAEIYREVKQALGVDWRAISFGASTAGPTSGVLLGSNTMLANQEDIKSMKDTVLGANGIGGKGNSKWFLQTGGSNHLSALLDVLAEEKFSYLLAEPTLIAVSGQKATFLCGGEYGYQVTQTGEGGSNTTEFKEWGTSLEFTPIVLSEDRIRITVKPKISALVPKNGSIPELTSKEAETTIELGSGQSLAIAGLLQSDKSSDVYETPLLSHLPLFGPLFRHSDVAKKQREVVIIVTPYIVKPSSKALKMPTDFVPKMYSPIEVLLRGKTHEVRRGGVGVLSVK